MRKYIIASMIVFFSVTSFAQRRPQEGENRGFVNPKPIYIETNIVPSDTMFVCFVSYKIPYSNLVFTRQDELFKGGLILNVEAANENGIVDRNTSTDRIIANNYDDTKKSDKYLEGLLTLNLKVGSYELNPLIGIINTDREIPLKPVDLNFQEDSVKVYYKPLVVESSKNNCSDFKNLRLVNFGNSIPFGRKNIDLLFPVYDMSVESLKVEIKQDGSTLYEDELTDPEHISFSVDECEEKIALKENAENDPALLFLAENVSGNLDEGKISVYVSYNDSAMFVYDMDVLWVEKPKALFNPEFAYKLLSIVSNEDTLDNILDRNDDDYQKALKEYWRQLSTGNNNYHALMSEFYSRADFAQKEFSVPGKMNGALTDRGKIFIKYGEPSNVERYYDEKNRISEVWKYDSLKVNFVFVDQTGLGNYKLQQ